MTRCKNAPETIGRANPPVQIKYFEDDEAKARYQKLKGRQTLPEKGFVFKGTSPEGFPASVMATIAMHKWEKFATHPGTADPQKKPINVTLVQEFYLHLTSPTQSAVYVRGEQIQFTAAKINKFYGLQNTADNHSKFVSGLKGKSDDFLLQDLCIPGADWDSANTSVERDRHTATASLSRLQLLHSILNGRSIDVGKIIVDEAYACLTRKSSPLLFPHLVTALCRKKGVFESPEDFQRKGRLGITSDSIPSLMGFDEAATSKQPAGGPKTIAVARLAALSTMAETTKLQLEELKADLCTYFKYVQERDQVIKANFNEMLPQSPLDFPSFPQDLFKPAATKAHEAPTTQPPAKQTPNPPQDKPFGSDSASSSPTPDASPLTKRRKGKEPKNTPAMPAVEIDSEEAAAFEEEEEPQRTPTSPVAPTPVRRRTTKRTAGRVLVEDSEEEVQSGAGEEDQPTIIPPTHPISIKHKATKRARRATTK
ncbi:hypothetical protein V6N13_046313 [Hibiscus sabdariffa]|uniref:Putative plant transposon protein domain-containing protein n=1 Tax=Hibiscus sabdariffa TaxID=183260 RepID=A0ABR2D9S8_9ROSI